MATLSASSSAALTVQQERDHALDLVESAIALVAGGGARRVTLVIPQAQLVLSAAQASARQLGVVARADWGPGGSCDIVISPVA